MTDNHWQAARLIPTSGINGADEQERRAASALLAVLGAVREFGTALLKPLGAPSGPVEVFIEVPFVLADGRSCRPDGLIRVTRGGKVWTCLVELKTGTHDLGREQVENYLDVARQERFEAVLTISNQFAVDATTHPVCVDKRKLRTVALYHRSWSEIVGEAVVQRIHRGISDPDQAWLLGELIRYLEDPKSGALEFCDMGSSWTTARDATVNGTLKAKDAAATETAMRFEQLLRFAALRLTRELGVTAQVLTHRAHDDAATRTALLASSLAETGTVAGALRIPNTAGDLTIEANLRTGRVTTGIDIAAPNDGRNQTRVLWLLRQLAEAHPQTRIEARAQYQRTRTSELLGKLRDEPALVIEDKSRPITAFTVSQSSALGTKRGVGKGSFIDSVLHATDAFYSEVVQQLRAWSAKAPEANRRGRGAPRGGHRHNATARVAEKCCDPGACRARRTHERATSPSGPPRRTSTTRSSSRTAKPDDARPRRLKPGGRAAPRSARGTAPARSRRRRPRRADGGARSDRARAGCAGRIEVGAALQEPPQGGELRVLETAHVPRGEVLEARRLDGHRRLRSALRDARLADDDRAGRDVAEALIQRLTKTEIAPTK